MFKSKNFISKEKPRQLMIERGLIFIKMSNDLANYSIFFKQSRHCLTSSWLQV